MHQWSTFSVVRKTRSLSKRTEREECGRRAASGRRELEGQRVRAHRTVESQRHDAQVILLDLSNDRAGSRRTATAGTQKGPPSRDSASAPSRGAVIEVRIEDEFEAATVHDIGPAHRESGRVVTGRGDPGVGLARGTGETVAQIADVEGREWRLDTAGDVLAADGAAASRTRSCRGPSRAAALARRPRPHDSRSPRPRARR